MENPAKFRLIFLPRVALDEVISIMGPFELINFSKISPRTEMIVKTLPARKRSYEVMLKIAPSSSLAIYGSKRNWELASTQNFSQNKDTCSRHFQLQHFKEIYEHIKRILNFSIRKVFVTLDALMFDTKSMIDWVKSQHESYEELSIVSLASYDNFFKYLLSNVKVTKCLRMRTESKLQFEWDELLPKNLDLVKVNASNGISLKQLLRMDSSRIILRRSKLTSREINLFLRSWMASESNLNLEYFEVNIKRGDDVNIYSDLPLQDMIYENGKIFREGQPGQRTLNHGSEIKQSSGKTGVVGTMTLSDAHVFKLFVF